MQPCYFFTGCEKESPVCSINDDELTETELKGVTTPADPPTPWGMRRQWSSLFNDCIYITPYNCYDDVIIIAPKPGSLAVRGIISEVKNKGNVTSFVEQNYAMLNTYIKTTHLESVVSGKLEISTQENKGKSINFVIFTDKVSGDVSAVYPFVLK